MPIHTRASSEQSNGHVHRWIEAQDPTERRCGNKRSNGLGCGAILVNQFEYNHRKEAWDNYFELITTTPSYLEYLETRDAFKTRNIEELAKLKEKRAKRGQIVKNEYGDEIFELQDSPLEKPNFKDPSSYTLYIIA